jgi:hypothetical protein
MKNYMENNLLEENSNNHFLSFKGQLYSFSEWMPTGKTCKLTHVKLEIVYKESQVQRKYPAEFV